MKITPVMFERFENAALAITMMIFFVKLNFNWWWLPIFFLVVDLSAMGYIINNKVGAFIYNLGHSYIGPALLLVLFMVATTRSAAFIGLIWAFHIAVDRLLGYGLKYNNGFSNTHLGIIGKKKS